MNSNTLGLIISFVALLLGGGLLPMFLSHSNKQAVQGDRQDRMQVQLDNAHSDLTKLRTEQAVTSQNVNEIKSKLDKLDLLEVVHANVENLKHIADHMIPRKEAEAELTAVKHRVETVEQIVFHTAKQ